MKIIKFNEKNWSSATDLLDEVSNKITRMTLYTYLKGIEQITFGKTKFFEINEETIEIINKLKNKK